MQGVRLASGEDLDRLVELADGAAAELSLQRGGQTWLLREARAEPRRPGLARAVEDPAQRVVLGTIDEVVVGYGIARVEPLHDAGQLGVVSDLYVEPAARGVGVGEEMMQHLVEWCDDRGCVGVDSLALPGDRATKNFFESFGLVARAIIVHRRLR